MQKAVRHLAEQWAGVRPDTLNLGSVVTFRVAAHGNIVAPGKLAGVTSEGDRIVVTPFDPTNVPAVVKALDEAKLNAFTLNPRAVAVGVPLVSGGQRAEIAKHVKKLGEEAKVAVRSIRQDARKQIAVQVRGS